MMRSFRGDGIGKIVILNFERGELLLEGIRKKIKELEIKNAVCISGIGTFEKVVYHRVKSTAIIPEDEFLTIEAPMELSSIDGIVADGEPHFHMVFSDLEKTYSGHLENGCVVLYLAEIVLAEIEGLELKRVAKESSIKLIERS